MFWFGYSILNIRLSFKGCSLQEFSGTGGCNTHPLADNRDVQDASNGPPHKTENPMRIFLDKHIWVFVVDSSHGERYEREAGHFMVDPICHLKDGCEGCRVEIYQFKQEGKTIKYVAGKRMFKSQYPNFQNEIYNVAKYSDHTNIARYDSHSEPSKSDFVTLYTELCDFSLEEFIGETLKTEESCLMPDSKDILKQAVEAIKYLHGHGVLHMDIKPSNFLFKKHKESATKSTYVLKLIDFGLSKVLDADRSRLVSHDAFGTKSYMAPEQYGKKVELTKATDMFSLGLLFYYVLTNGEHPFGDDETDIAYKIKHYTEHPALEALDFEDNKEYEVLARDLVLRMIQKSPQDRPTIEEVEIHPFFWNAYTKQTFYKVANDIVQKRKGDNKFANSLNQGMGSMKLKDLKLPVEKIMIPAIGKKTLQENKGYSNVQEFIRFLRNMLEHSRPDVSRPPELQDQRKALHGCLTDDVEIRLPKLTKPYPRLLHHLYYLLQKEESFIDAFKKDAKVNLAKVTSAIREPNVKATV